MISYGKKAAMNLVDNWVDYAALLCLILGTLMTFIAGSKVLSVLIVFISSLIIGRAVYLRTSKHQLRFWYPVMAFLLGLIFGARFLSYKEVLLTFVLGAVFGYYIKKKHVLE